MLRHLPVFGIFGRGDYRVQPVCVEDLADLAVVQASEAANVTLDAVGPETFSYEELVRTIAAAVNSKARIVHIPPTLALAIGRLLGWRHHDVPITREEIAGLMSNRLVSDSPPTCPTRFTDWLSEHADALGVCYASELLRHYRG